MQALQDALGRRPQLRGNRGTEIRDAGRPDGRVCHSWGERGAGGMADQHFSGYSLECELLTRYIHVYTYIFYHMKTVVANFLISYFIMEFCGLEKYKAFYILEIIYFGSTFL